MSVTFWVPEVEIAVPDDQVEPVRRELAALDATPLGSGARALLERLERRERIDMQTIAFAEFWALLRALDHVRNAHELGRDGQRLRDALVAGSIPYRLRPFGGGQDLGFTSYAGTYLPADRLVRSPGEVYRVVDTIVDEDDPEPTVLVIDEWREPLYG